MHPDDCPYGLVVGVLACSGIVPSKQVILIRCEHHGCTVEPVRDGRVGVVAEGGPEQAGAPGAKKANEASPAALAGEDGVGAISVGDELGGGFCEYEAVSQCESAAVLPLLATDLTCLHDDLRESSTMGWSELFI